MKSIVRALCVAGIPALTLLAACGSSSYGTGQSPAAAPATSATTTPPASVKAAAKAVVATAMNARLGTVLADAQGRTLYTLSSGGHAVACTGDCLAVWPPLLLPAGTTSARGAAGAGDIGVVAVAGGMQVTEAGAPLHTFSGDAAPGDANGEGIVSFGGVWHVATPHGVPASPSGAADASTAPASTAPVAPATTSGSSGYSGYYGG